MAAVTSISDLISLLTGGGAVAAEHLPFFKVDRTQAGAAPTAPVAGRFTSLWGYAGSPSGADVAGTIPSAAAQLTRSTTGALKQANPGGGRQKWLVGVEFMESVVGAAMMYDRVAQCGGLDGTLTTVQTISGGLTPGRYTSGDGIQMFVEIYTALGATATTIAATYTNQAGTGSRVTPAVTIGGTGWNEVGRMIPLPLQAGDTGVQSVQSVQLAASTLTAGNFGVTLVREITPLFAAQIGTGFPRDLISGLPGICEILTDACLAMAYMSSGVTVPQFYGQIHTVEK